MTYVTSFLLGLVQGVAEFLPISSSGHLAIAQNLLGMSQAGSVPEFFDVLLHLGTLVAVFAAYWHEICDMVVEFFRGIGDLVHRTTPTPVPPARRLILLIVVGTLPLFAVLPIRKAVQGLSDNMFFVGGALIFTGLLLFVCDGVRKGRKTERSATWLDALLVGVFRWGLAGAALATGLSQTVGAVIPMAFFLNRENGSALHFSFTPMEAHPLFQACGNGASELMSNISGSIAAMVYNFQLLKFLGEDGVSAYGVIMYVGFIFVAIFVGYSIGSAPIISFHFGAENREELKNMFRKSYLLMAVWGIAMALAAYLLAGPLARLFVGYDRQLCELTVHAMQLHCLAFLFTGANIFTSSLFTALNDGTVSAAVSFARSMVLQIATVLLLPGLMGPDGLWLAALATDTCALVIDICVLGGNRKKYGYC